MNADSVPSQCMNCLVNYYRQGYTPDIVSKIYFCETCRDGLSLKEWKLLEEFHRLISLSWCDASDAIFDFRFQDVDYRLARTQIIRTVYESFRENAPREAIFAIFNGTNLANVLRSRLLDLLELLEDYDTLIKEKQNGQTSKTSTNT